MRRIRIFATLVIAGALAAAGPPASALTAYNQSTSAALAVGTTLTWVQSGTSTISGSFFGFSVTITCTGSTLTGALEVNNGGALVTGRVSLAAWSGCSSNLKSPCTVSAVGLPWNPANHGGFAANSTTIVGIGTGNAGGGINVTDCLNGIGSCSVTGPSASWSGLANVALATWTNATPQMHFNTSLVPRNCTGSNMAWLAQYVMSTAGTANVGLRTP